MTKAKHLPQVNLTAWAEANGFNPSTVRKLVAGLYEGKPWGKKGKSKEILDGLRRDFPTMGV